MLILFSKESKKIMQFNQNVEIVFHKLTFPFNLIQQVLKITRFPPVRLFVKSENKIQFKEKIWILLTVIVYY